EKMTVKNGDTLAQDWPEDPERPNEGVQFDAVVMNPPYSVKNWNQEGLKVTDPRFEIAGILPPDSKGDYAFLLHGLFHLGQEGTMAIVLPHGVLFRGGAEGEIRKRLLDKNHIDAVIGLPDKLFTNTGIPVTVIILKKNRALDAPVLMIDASKSFVKEGKQNVLQEKDIDKIVDTYIERTEEKGYSHKASQKEIKENEYNLNIPRYIEALDEEIAQDVDAHLYGGIPLHQIEQLTVLHDMTKDVLYETFNEVRPGYVTLTKSIDDLTEDVLADEVVQKQMQALKAALQTYMHTYWDELKTVHDVNDIDPLKDEMLTGIKELLREFNHVSTYAGYQIIAELWENMLAEDTEKIAISDFYTVARTREANIVTKGSGKTKRTEQDGWIGAIVPNDLILKELYTDELKEVEAKQESIASITDEINELVEAAKVEESEEEAVLGETLNVREDDFTLTAIKAELKNVEKDSSEYELLDKVKNLLDEKSALNKDMKAKEKALNEYVEDRIENLSDAEIDLLMYQKWFGGLTKAMTGLIEIPLKNELDILKDLKERFSGFDEEWIENKLGDIIEITMEHSPQSSNYTNNSSDYILVQGNADIHRNKVCPRVWTTQLTKQANKEDLIMTVRAPVGEIAKTDFNVVLGRGVAGLKGNDFIFYSLVKKKLDGYWTRLSTGSTFDSVNSYEIKDVDLLLPTEEEQQKIVELFTILDERIANQERKIAKVKALKDAYLTEMFPQEGETVPKRRFKGFEEEWKGI